jgi:hydroxyacylglutathione hydrolase
LVREPQSGSVGVVDPAVAGPVLAEAAKRRWKITHILNTHHHGDHVGGNREIKEATGCTIVGPRRDRARIPGIDVEVDDGERYRFGEAEADVFFVPGHTSGHIAYAFREQKALFCGDTLFALGCGRLFEGTPQQMHASLARLASLPDETRVCCAHEYTLSNLRFAHAVEPANDDVVRHRQWCEGERATGRPTLPSRISRERRINPFLRCDVPGVIAAARAHGARDDSGPAVFAALRRWKDQFR